MLVIPAFTYFILFAILEMKLIVMLWKIKYLAQFDNQNDVRKALAKFYIKFYGSMIAAFYFIFRFNLIFHNWFILAAHLFLVP